MKSDELRLKANMIKEADSGKCDKEKFREEFIEQLNKDIKDVEFYYKDSLNTLNKEWFSGNLNGRKCSLEIFNELWEKYMEDN